MSDTPEVKQPQAVAPTQVVPAVPTQVTPAVPAASQPSASDFALLAQIMLQREARAAAKEQAEQNAKDARDKQRDINARSHYEDDKSNQAKCKHLKGGKLRRPTQAKDYAVYIHTYINSERVIKCMLCNMKWKIRDTKEFLFRYGKRIQNHTQIGWNEAMEMLGQTSNMPSSSEIPMNATPLVASTEEV